MTLPPRVAAIVEGHGDCLAVPVLLRRVGSELTPPILPEVLRPVRVPAARLVRTGELERTLTLAAAKLGGTGGIIVILDGDWDGCCPATDGPALLARARAHRSDLPIKVVLAKKEFESWFLAAAPSLTGKRGLPPDLMAPPVPEAIRGAKEWLSLHMPRGRSYVETEDQPAFASVFDMQAARRSDSFDKCYRDIADLLAQLQAG